METPYRLHLLGAEVDIVTPSGVMQFLAERIASGERGIVANHNFHSLCLYQKHAPMRAFYQRADLIEIDSTPLIAWARLLGYKVTTAHRSTYLDFRETFWDLVLKNGWRVYHVGGLPEHAELSRQAIVARYPDVQLYTHSGYFDIVGAENDALLADLNEKAPHVVLIGMGMPRQEVWIERNYDRMPKSVILPVGGAFDYEAGVTYTPPRWTGRVGVEWLVRFIHEPSRLFDRYFVEPWELLPLFFKDLGRRGAIRERAAEIRYEPEVIEVIVTHKKKAA